MVAARPLRLLTSRDLGVTSVPGEDERMLRIRLAEVARQARDAAIDGLRRKHASKVATLQEKVRKAEARLARESSQASASTIDTAVTVGTSVLGALFGRKTISVTNLGRARSAARAATRLAEQKGYDGVARLKRTLSEAGIL